MTYMWKQDRLLLLWVLFPWKKTKLFMAHRPEEPVSRQSITVLSSSSKKQVFNRKITCIFLSLASKRNSWIRRLLGKLSLFFLGNTTDLSAEATKVNTKKLLIGALIAETLMWYYWVTDLDLLLPSVCVCKCACVWVGVHGCKYACPFRLVLFDSLQKD